MKEDTIIGYLVAMTILAFCILIGFAVKKSHENAIEDKARKELIGHRCVVNRDTLTIIRYNSHSGWNFDKGFVMSNGITVDENLVLNHLVEE